MRERIGKVWFEDWATDKGLALRTPDETERRLLTIFSAEPLSAEEELTQRPTWPMLQQLSPLRESLMRWISLPPGAEVLELGAECGGVTGAFLEKGAQVLSTDVSPIRCRINALRHREAEGLRVLAAAPEAALDAWRGRADLIAWTTAPLLPDRDEENPAPLGAEAVSRLLAAVWAALKPGGTFWAAAENPLGMKYFAGRPEALTGRLFAGIEGDAAAGGITRGEWKRLAEANGFDVEWYYPYPDRWFPEKIYSDGWLPREGELGRNWQTFDADRVIVFDEEKAFDTVIRAGLFPEFSNAFLLCLRRKGGGDA